jgi:Zinc-binding dehydrogenase
VSYAKWCDLAGAEHDDRLAAVSATLLFVAQVDGSKAVQCRRHGILPDPLSLSDSPPLSAPSCSSSVSRPAAGLRPRPAPTPESLTARSSLPVSSSVRALTVLDAAALPVSGTTVLTALTEEARLTKGERLLVRGATGGVGSIAVQLGNALGAHVTALAGARNLDWVRELGADTALDYRTTRPADLDPFDVILDAVGTDMGAYRRRLTRRGRIVELAFDEDHLVSSFASVAWNTATKPRKIKAFSNNPSAERIAELTRYVESGAIRPVVDALYPMASIAEAHRRLEAGGVRGRLVIDMQQPDPDPLDP